MTELGIFLFHGAAVGIGATALMDLWTVIRRRVFAIPMLDYGQVGRWLGHMAQGRYRHDAIGTADPIPCERVIGWLFHYLTGMIFAAILLFFWGSDWGHNPTIGPALIVGISTAAAPFLIMQPAMGYGIAASRTPHPAAARFHSVITHIVFGLGLYVTALMIVASGYGPAFSGNT